MVDAIHVASFDLVGCLDRRRPGEACGAGRVGFELSGADAADRARFAVRAVHVARRADFPGILFASFGIHAAKLVALEGEAGRWDFTILTSCPGGCSHRWWGRLYFGSCHAIAKTGSAS